MKKIGANNYVASHKVLGARIYQKDGIIKVAITVDAKSSENQVVFSDPQPSVEEAEKLVYSLCSEQ